MKISIGGFSFHRLLESGKQDIFGYIRDCKALGATQLDPWNAQLAPLRSGDEAAKAGSDPAHARLSAQDDSYLRQVRDAADKAALPFGCIAVDGAHIYEPDPAARESNRRLADRWLEVGRLLGAAQVRIDAGGPQDLTDAVFDTIIVGYLDLMARARDKGIEILMENHWGPSVIPDQVVRIIEAAEGLGLLFDSHNWAEGYQQEGWGKCAKYARSTHFKTFRFDENGLDPSVDLPRCIGLLKAHGYTGCWGVESVPEDGDEYEAVRKTIALLRKYAG